MNQQTEDQNEEESRCSVEEFERMKAEKKAEEEAKRVEAEAKDIVGSKHLDRMTRMKKDQVKKVGYKPKPGYGWNPVLNYFPRRKPCVCSSEIPFKDCCMKGMAECLPLAVCVQLYDRLEQILDGTIRFRTRAQAEIDKMEELQNETEKRAE